MKKYRGVVIGCGRIGATYEMDSLLVKPASHAAALAQNPRTELVGLVEPDSAARERAAEYYKVPAYGEARACLEALAPDIVVIATPPDTHEECLALTLALGVPAVILEKPVSGDRDAAKRMIARAKGSGTVVIVNHQRRFLPLFEDARARIASGALGAIQQANAQYSNGIFNNGSHTVDTLSFLLGDTVAWAIGVENEHNTTAPFGPNIDGMLGFTKGAVAMLQSFDNNDYSPHEYSIFGTRGAILIRHHGFRFEYVPVREAVTFSAMNELDWMNADVQLDRRSMLAGTVAHAVDCLDEAATSGSTIEDGYRTMEVLNALVESAAAGGKKISLAV